MNDYQQTDLWCITEEGFQPDNQLASESSLGISNGYIGQRADFEEHYSGVTKSGSYIAGVYYQETYQNKAQETSLLNSCNRLLNTPDWDGIIVRLNDEIVDLATWEVQNFKRTLNMHDGVLERTFEAVSPRNHRIKVSVKRFLSMAKTEIAAINYSVKSLDFDGRISFMPIINADVKNPYLNDNEQLWNVLQIKAQQDVSYLWAQARHKNFQFCGAHSYALYKNNEQLKVNPTKIEKERIAGFSIGTDVKKGDTVYMNKYIAITDSLTQPNQNLPEYVCQLALEAKEKGWTKLLEEHSGVWAAKWFQANLAEGSDVETQQAIRHKIFMNNMYFDNE